jgi:hypothetical protein
MKYDTLLSLYEANIFKKASAKEGKTRQEEFYRIELEKYAADKASFEKKFGTLQVHDVITMNGRTSSLENKEPRYFVLQEIENSKNYYDNDFPPDVDILQFVRITPTDESAGSAYPEYDVAGDFDFTYRDLLNGYNEAGQNVELGPVIEVKKDYTKWAKINEYV